MQLVTAATVQLRKEKEKISQELILQRRVQKSEMFREGF